MAASDETLGKLIQDEQRKMRLFHIEVDKIDVLRQSLKAEIEEEKIAIQKRKKLRQKKAVTEEEKEEEAAIEHMGQMVREMKTLSKSSSVDPLTESITGVLSLYQGRFKQFPIQFIRLTHKKSFVRLSK